MLWQTDYTWEPKTEIENAVLPAFDVSLTADVSGNGLVVKAVHVGTWIRPSGAVRSILDSGPAYDLLKSPDPLLKAIGERVKADAEANKRFVEITCEDVLEAVGGMSNDASDFESKLIGLANAIATIRSESIVSLLEEAAAMPEAKMVSGDRALAHAAEEIRKYLGGDILPARSRPDGDA